MRRLADDDETPTWARWQPATDVQFSVRGMLKSDGAPADRVDYQAYGHAEHHWGGDVDGDGDVDSADSTAMTTVIGASPSPVIGASTYKVEYDLDLDLDRDGDVDASDGSMIGSSRAALPSGWLSGDASGDPDNPVGFDGYIFSKEVDHYCVRFRWCPAPIFCTRCYESRVMVLAPSASSPFDTIASWAMPAAQRRASPAEASCFVRAADAVPHRAANTAGGTPPLNQQPDNL